MASCFEIRYSVHCAAYVDGFIEYNNAYSEPLRLFSPAGWDKEIVAKITVPRHPTAASGRVRQMEIKMICGV